MVLTTKQRRGLNIFFIALFVAVILSGIGLGIFFMLKDEGGLTARQKQFGYNVNASNLKAQVQNIDTERLPSDVEFDDIVICSGDYVVTKDLSENYLIYSLVTNQTVPIDSMVTYDAVKAIYNNFAFVSQGDILKLINLKTGRLTCVLSNVSYVMKNNYLLLETSDGNKISYSEDLQTENNVLSVLINMATTETIFKVTDLEFVIDVELTNNYFIATYRDKTDIYSLNNFALVKSFDNVGEEALQTSNVVSFVDGKTYHMATYFKAYELSKNAVLIEKMQTTNNDDFDIKANLYSGLEQGYYLSYQIFDLKTSKLIDLKASNNVVKKVDTNLGDDYFAVLFCPIKDKAIIQENKSIIKYYQIDKRDNSRKIYNIVSYDYNAFGKIVGFNGNSLVTSGGTNSTTLDFNGNKNTSLSLNDGDKISMSNYDNVVVVSSLIGQKRILSKTGETLVEGNFSKVSPFIDGYAIAQDIDGYYLISAKGQKTIIDNFAVALSDYVFMGIGFYFTEEDEMFNVYNIKGEKLYSHAVVTLTYDAAINKILLAVKADKNYLIDITPINKLLITDDKSAGNNVQLNNLTIKSFGLKSYVKNVAEEDDEITPTIDISVNDEFGYGTVTNTFDLDFSSITFTSFDQLTEWQKNFLPAFDDEENCLYVSEGYTFAVEGMHVYTGYNYSLAIIQLAVVSGGDESLTGGYYYMITLAMKNSYLYSLEATSSLLENQSEMLKTYHNGIVNASIDASTRVIPAVSLDGKGLTYFDQSIDDEARVVNYNSVGYDGGLILASTYCDKINLTFTMSNIFNGNDYDTNYIDWTGFALSEPMEYDFEKYQITILNDNGTSYAQISAKEGYLITEFDFVTAKASTNTYEDIEILTQEQYTTLSSFAKFVITQSEGEFSLFKFTNVCIVERYSILSFVGFEGSEETESEKFTTYYFHGYGQDLVSSYNPAYFGFENFARKTQVNVLERRGYEFKGYSLNGEMVVGESGLIIAAIDYKNLFSIDTSAMQPQTFNLKAEWEAKRYYIYFVNDGEALSGQEKNVTFDQSVGVLPSLEKEGHTFVGWFDVNSSEGGNCYTADTIYKVDDDITLYARWTPDVYTLTFDANISSYQDLDVGGFVYNITDVYFMEAIGEAVAGDDFSGYTKNITYGLTYGALPRIVAYNSENSFGGKKEIYVFKGWFDAASGGTLYDGHEEVSLSSARTLYAQYEREVYNISLETNGSFDTMAYVGSTDAGVKTTMSTRDTWSDEANIYQMYSLQGEDAILDVSVLQGTYVSSIEFKVYDNFGNTTTYVIDGVWNSLAPTNYGVVLAEGSEELPSNITVVNDGFNLKINLTKMFEAYNKKYADIKVTIENMQFSNVIKITAPEGQDLSAIIMDSDDNEMQEYTQSDASYNNSLTLRTKSNSVNNSSGEVVDKSYLTKITVDGTTINFTVNYDLTSKRNVISTDYEALETNAYSSTYIVGNVTFVITYNNGTGLYECMFTIINTENHLIDVEYGIKTIVTSIVSNNCGEGSIDGIDVTSNISNLSTNSIVSSDTIVYNVKPKENILVNYISVKIGSGDYQYLAYPGYEIKELNVVQNMGKIVNANLNPEIVGTNVKISYNQEAESFVITINNISSDISFLFDYVTYKLIHVDVEQEGDNVFDIVTQNGDNLNALTKTQQADRITSGDIYKFGVAVDADTYRYNYLILGLSESVNTLTLNTLVESNYSYKIAAVEPVGSEQIVLDSNKTSAQIKEVFASKFVIELVDISVAIKSYLGIGGGDFESDPRTGFGLLTQLTARYYDINNLDTATSSELNSSVLEIELLGSYLSIEISDIEGYIYNSSRTGLFASGEKLPVDYSKSGSVHTLTYTLTDLSIDSYTFDVYFDAIEYDVNYISIDGNGVSSETVGRTENSHHVYNVWSNLSTNGYSRTGYTFLGYSKEEVSGIDLSEVDYTSNQVLEENLTSTNGATVTLYSVFRANEYNIVLNENDETHSNGSSPADIISGSTLTVKFDHSFGILNEATRQGYTFLGWFVSKDVGSVQVSQGDKLNLELYNNIITKTDVVGSREITLYAKWDKIKYTLTINPNDVSYSNGSSQAADDGLGGYTQEVTYDTEFTLGAIKRIGYDFLGYKSVKLSSDQAKVNSLDYIANGINSHNKIDYSIGNASSGYNLLIDDVNRTITLYAVYVAKVFKAYVNLNNDVLKTYGRNDGKFKAEISGGGNVETSTHYTDLFVEFEFDKQMGNISTISVTPIGYIFEGLYSNTSFDLMVNSDTNKITATTVFNKELFDKLTYRASGDNLTDVTELLTLYNSNPQKLTFSMYAHYTYKDYSINYINGKNTSEIYLSTSAKGLDYEYSGYNYKNTNAGSADLSITTTYGNDFVLDIMTNEGYYVSKILLNYNNGSTEKSSWLLFTWNTNKSLVATFDGEELAFDLDNYTNFMGQTAYVIDGMYLKVIPYNEDGSDVNNVVYDAFRIVLGFDFVKSNFTISAESERQYFDVEYYRQFNGYSAYIDEEDLPDNYLYTKQIYYGDAFNNEWLEKVYTRKFNFDETKGWRYGSNNLGVLSWTENQALVGDIITENKYIVGNYDISLDQSVTYYFWDITTSSYVERTITSEEYIFAYYHSGLGWVGGENDENLYDLDSYKTAVVGGVEHREKNNTAGKVLKLPTSSSELWPEGTFFAGFVVTDVAPVGYYTSEIFNSLPKFDNTTIVEEKFVVYAVYDEANFELSMNGNQAKVDLSFGEILPDGTVSLFNYSDVYVLGLSSVQKAEYDAKISTAGYTKEVALREILNANYSGAEQLTSINYTSVTPADYYIAVIFKINEYGNRYLYAVSENVF